MDAIFFVDGFNLYHSITDLQKKYGVCYKWLDLKALCENIASKIRNNYGEFIEVKKIYYFTAYAYHRGNDAVNRHKRLIRCYEDQDIIISISRFKKKSIKCDLCNKRIVRREEKETDVALATRLLLEAAQTENRTLFILITGDTDLKPALDAIHILNPKIDIWIAFPYRRRNADLENVAKGSIELKKEDYAHCQLPNPYIPSKGKPIHKPALW
ncbi:hypothetical protein Rhom172_2679 [Rhodothermus marinus SG0.5JP17-172]|jgi:uncharacterized LabA/DUF88 family protein|uniref:NYN domain-containing protein n=1 Tax=Rhodothermus marinus TaxID=29549 RepID=UPI000223DEA1|nr:NYN domain-containing protein [Rhodothermus marinus]AEN74566.1 hypothetical protein Rhom172_2679 [Rhodothermus marinus SG0.5JP17-172]